MGLLVIFEDSRFDQFAKTLRDVPDSEGLYSLVAKRGFYFKNHKGYDGLAGATVQITKNYATLGDMLGRIQTLSACFPDKKVTLPYKM